MQSALECLTSADAVQALHAAACSKLAEDARRIAAAKDELALVKERRRACDRKAAATAAEEYAASAIEAHIRSFSSDFKRLLRLVQLCLRSSKGACQGGGKISGTVRSLPVAPPGAVFSSFLEGATLSSAGRAAATRLLAAAYTRALATAGTAAPASVFTAALSSELLAGHVGCSLRTSEAATRAAASRVTAQAAADAEAKVRGQLHVVEIAAAARAGALEEDASRAEATLTRLLSVAAASDANSDIPCLRARHCGSGGLEHGSEANAEKNPFMRLASPPKTVPTMTKESSSHREMAAVTSDVALAGWRAERELDSMLQIAADSASQARTRVHVHRLEQVAAVEDACVEAAAVESMGGETSSAAAAVSAGLLGPLRRGGPMAGALGLSTNMQIDLHEHAQRLGATPSSKAGGALPQSRDSLGKASASAVSVLGSLEMATERPPQLCALDDRQKVALAEVSGLDGYSERAAGARAARAASIRPALRAPQRVPTPLQRSRLLASMPLQPFARFMLAALPRLDATPAQMRSQIALLRAPMFSVLRDAEASYAAKKSPLMSAGRTLLAESADGVTHAGSSPADICRMDAAGVARWAAGLAALRDRAPTAGAALAAAGIDGEALLALSASEAVRLARLRDSVAAANALLAARAAAAATSPVLALRRMAAGGEASAGSRQLNFATRLPSRAPPPTVVFAAARAGRAGAVMQALCRGFDIHVREETRDGPPCSGGGGTLLHAAAAGGHARLCAALLARGADASALDSCGLSAAAAARDGGADPEGRLAAWLAAIV